MLIFNREREEIRKERERREREWQEELDRSMSLSDPTGQGSGFCGSKLSIKGKKTSKEEKKDEALEGVLSTLIAASALSFSASIGPFEGIERKDQLKENRTQDNLVGAKTENESDIRLLHAEQMRNLGQAKEQSKKKPLQMVGQDAVLQESELESELESEHHEVTEKEETKLSGVPSDDASNGSNINNNSKAESKSSRNVGQEESIKKRSSWHQISEFIQEKEAPSKEKTFELSLKDISVVNRQKKCCSLDSCKAKTNNADISLLNATTRSSLRDEISLVSSPAMTELGTSSSQTLLINTPPSSSLSIPSNSSAENMISSSNSSKDSPIVTSSLSCLTMSSVALCSSVPASLLSSSSSALRPSKTAFYAPLSAPYFSSCCRSPMQVPPKRSYSLNMQSMERHGDFLQKRSSDGFQITDDATPNESQICKSKDESANGFASSKRVLMMSKCITPGYSSSLDYVSSNSSISTDPTVTASLTKIKGTSLDEKLLTTSHNYNHTPSAKCKRHLPAAGKTKYDKCHDRLVFKPEGDHNNDFPSTLTDPLSTCNRCEGKVNTSSRIINKTMSSQSLIHNEVFKSPRRVYGRSASAESSNKNPVVNP